MNILLITYYFDQNKDVGAQRWIKNLKYLEKKKNKITVFTFKKSEETTNIKILVNNRIEPNYIYKKLFKKNVPKDILTRKKNHLIDKLLIFIRSNLFIPDSRVLFYFSSIKILKNHLKNNSYDIVISSGPPHSMHLIARKISSKFKIPWVADFRDPWTKIEYFKKLPISKISKYIHEILEKKIIKDCDCLITVSDYWGNHFKKIGANRVKVINNGYDKEDFKYFKSEPNNVSIAHFGTFPESRNNKTLLSVLDLIFNDKLLRKKMKVSFYGYTYENFKSDLNIFQYKSRVSLYSHLDYDEAIEKMQNYRYLLVSLSRSEMSKGRIPLKIYDYMASKRKIIAIGEKGTDLENIINNYKLGIYIYYGKETVLFNYIKKDMETVNKPNISKSYNNFSKEYQVEKLNNILIDISNKKNIH